jgi:hypothetical protein
LHKSLLYQNFAVYRIHFRSARTSALYILFSYISVRLYSIWYCASVNSIQDRYYIDRRVSRLRNFLLTGSLPYTGFTFDLPERQSYIIYYLRLYIFSKIESCILIYISYTGFACRATLLHYIYNSPYIYDQQSFRYIYQL